MSNSKPIQQKVYDATGGLSLANWLADFPRPLVFTNGCFDILHCGHVTYLEQAAALGKTLIVGVNSDESVRQLKKGAGRPIVALQDRMALLAALAVVDGVVAFAQATPAQLIAQIKPDHLVKGGDWPPEKIIGSQEVIARGGKVHSLKLTLSPQHSSSAIIARIQRSLAEAE